MNTSLVFGERVGCTIENSWKLVGCVRRGRDDDDDDDDVVVSFFLEYDIPLFPLGKRTHSLLSVEAGGKVK